MKQRVQQVGDEVFFTVTMAEVLERQGRMEDALVIYRYLAERTPGDDSLRRRIERLKAMALRTRRGIDKDIS